MCAITGIVTDSPIDIDLFTRMNNSAKHRGPDGDGFFVEDHTALGHRRLAIIDLSDLGHQPMQKNQRVITFNGEIYNYKEIRKELEGLGHTFNSNSDTEVILSAYEQWGQDCVQRFNGMWAFAIYNRLEKTLFCSRDRFGVKPFYYWRSARKIIFSSEIRQILTDPSVPRMMNQPLVSAYLVSSLVDHSSETFFKGILKLDPGHNLVIDCSTLQMKISKYFNVNQVNTHFVPSDFSDLMKDAVQLRLRSDTPVGSSLSGGLDSSLIVSLASRMTQTYKFQTFTAVPFDGYRDESSYVHQLSQDLPIHAHFTSPQRDDFQEALRCVVEIQEEPFISPSVLMQYFVMKKAHEVGLKVLLDGQGADEIFLGYEKYIPSLLQKVALLHPVEGSRNLIEVLRHNQNTNLSFLLKVFLKNKIKNQLSLNARLFQKSLQTEWRGDKTYIDVQTKSDNIFSSRISDIENYNLPALLRYEDKNSMHFGIETRLPFLDYRVVDVALKWPLHQLIKNGLLKAPLRELFKNELPDYIYERKSKFNFNAPSNIFFQNPTDLVRPETFSLFFRENPDFSKFSEVQRWKVLNICIWYEIFFNLPSAIP